MGKVKRAAHKHSNHHDSPSSNISRIAGRPHGQQQRSRPPSQATQKTTTNAGQQARLKVPFSRHDNLLLVGEGDFSFALSLKQHHKIGQLTATCFDDMETLESKYPHAQETIVKLNQSAQLYDVLNKQQYLTSKDGSPDGDEGPWEGFSPSPPISSKVGEHSDQGVGSTAAVLCGIDATKLSSAHKKALRPYSPFTKIVFNFPHVGGLSTDVNRQVRYNQELLVGFFKAAKPLLSSPARPARLPVYQNDDTADFDDMSEDVSHSNHGAVDGQMLVTLFEGEPYTLWNIRDLARHCGLKIVESFKFPWSAYPGYQHARTMGDINTGLDRSDHGKRKGAWRGEERDARCYVLEDQDAEPMPPRLTKKKRRRKDAGSDSD